MVIASYMFFFFATVLLGMALYKAFTWALSGYVKSNKKFAFWTIFTLWCVAFYLTSIHPFAKYYIACGKPPQFKSHIQLAPGGGIRVEFTALSSVDQLVKLAKYFGFVETETLLLVGIDVPSTFVKKPRSERAWHVAQIGSRNDLNCIHPIDEVECLIAERARTQSPRYEFIVERPETSSVYSTSYARLFFTPESSEKMEVAFLQHSNYSTSLISGPLSWVMPEWFNSRNRCSLHKAMRDSKHKADVFWQQLFLEAKKLN